MKTYRYRTHVRKMHYALYALSLIALLLPVADLLFIHTESYVASIVGVGLAIYFYLLSFALLPMASTEITLSREGVRFKNRRKDFLIQFHEIEKIDTKSIKNVGGYFTIVKSKKEKIRVTVVLEDIADFVKNLNTLLESNQVTYDKDKLFSFYKTAYFSDTSWERMYSIFPEIIIYIVLTIVFKATIGLYASSYYVDMFNLAFNVIIVAWGAITLIMEYGKYAKEIKESVHEENWEIDDRDPSGEFAFYRYSMRFAFAAIVIVYILFSA